MAVSSSAVLPSRMKCSTTSPQYFFTRYPLMRASGVRNTNDGGNRRFIPVSTRGNSASTGSARFSSEGWSGRSCTATMFFSTTF